MSKREKLWLYAILIIAMGTWGLSWTNGKILGGFTTVPNLMFWRFLIAMISMIPVLIYTGVDWKPSRKALVGILSSSLLLMSYNYFYFTGTKLGSAGAGGVLVTTLNPVLTFLLVSLVHKTVPRGRSLLGIGLGIFGGTIIIDIWSIGWQAVMVSGNQYFVLCASSWAFLTLISSTIHKQIHILAYSFWLYFFSALISLIFIDVDTVLIVFSLGSSFWINLLSISVGAMAFATTAFFVATTKLGSNRASAFIFTVPLSAMLFSVILLHEPLKLNVLMGGCSQYWRYI